MNQFYAPPAQISETEIILTESEAQHAAKVMRKNIGEEILVTDGCGTRYTGLIEHAFKRELRASILEKKRFPKPKLNIELCLGLIRKRDRLEFAAEKATELGVSSISLFHADHTEPFKVRVDRVEAAVLSAMKQSLRVYLPKVRLFDSLDDVLDRDLTRTQIIQADVDGGTKVDLSREDTEDVLMVVGPEGGLSEREEKLLKRKNARRISLGDFRLRAETAAMMMAVKFGINKADPDRSA
ncbi:RsmE family RNA methyltransferase [Rhodohalobacter sp. 8-1]|uniref:RsmE family RNA methyltransferase n=1 Tax=Rhodohalobacter sp. 8-1 TaxID=3131972 RepID=UPI0030EF7727